MRLICREDLENQFQKVKEYIANNRDTSVAAVAEACEVSEKQIKQWVREERLVFAEGVVSGITCEVCGATIATGRFCAKCKAQVVNDLTGAGRKAEAPTPLQRPTKESPRMRFLDNR